MAAILAAPISLSGQRERGGAALGAMVVVAASAGSTGTGSRLSPDAS